MHYNCVLSKFLNFVNDFNNYDVLKFFKLHINSNAPQTNPSITMYNHPPPGFNYCSNTAMAVSNSNPANADTGASGTYIAMRDIECIQNITPCSATSRISVQVANGQIISLSHVGELKVPDGTTLKAYIFAEISGSLLSVSQLVDMGFTVVYNSKNVEFIKNNITLFCGYRDAITRL